MKVLLLCNKPPYPARDGTSVALKVTTNSFRNEGVEVVLLVMNTFKHSMTTQDIPEEIRGKVEIDFLPVDIRIKPLQALKNLLFSKDPYHIERFDDAEYRKRMLGLIAKHNFDVIILEGLYMTAYLDDIRKHSNAKVVLRAHNLEQEIWFRLAENETNPLKKWYLNSLAQRHKAYEWAHLKGQYYDAIVSVSDRDVNTMRKEGVTLPIFTATYSIDLGDLPQPVEQEADPYSVFFIGALDWVPNMEGMEWFVKEVWDKVRAKHPQVKLYVAGRNMAPDFLFPEKEKNNIIKIGEVENAHTFCLEKGVMIVPLLSGGGIRIKIIEGMALGKAIVTSSLALEGNPATDNENICLADTPQAFADKVCELLENVPLRHAIGKNAAVFARNRFHNQTMTRNLLSFLQAIPSKSHDTPKV